MNYFIAVFTAFFLLLNYFVIRKILKYVVPVNIKIYVLIAMVVLASSFFIYRFISSKLSYSMGRILSYVCYYYLAFLIYATMFFMISWILTLILKNRVDINFYKISVILAIFTLIIGTYFKHNIVIKEYEVDLNEKYNIPSLNIALVSDIHLGYINGNGMINRMVKKINSLNPDVVLIAGDLIDMDLKPVIEKNMLESLGKIKSKHGTYLALGNHDIYGAKKEVVTTLAREEGVIVLRDEKILVDDSFYIVGRDDFPKKPLEEILEGKKEDKPVILIEHTPNRLDEAVENKINIQVSGHTHKGQFFPGNLFTKRIFQIDYGMEKIKDTNVIVSSGYGTWGPPIRIGSISEICFIKVKN